MVGGGGVALGRHEGLYSTATPLMLEGKHCHCTVRMLTFSSVFNNAHFFNVFCMKTFYKINFYVSVNVYYMKL